MQHRAIIVVLSVVSSCGLMLCGTGELEAQDRDPLVQMLMKKGILTEQDVTALEAELARTPQPRMMPPTGGETQAFPKSMEHWQWSGDIRLRNEYRARSGESREDINRQRIRFRLGLVAQLTEALNVGARIATGSLTDPASTNQTFDDTFAKKNFNLDRAYLQYTPAINGLDHLTVLGGLMANPFWDVGPLIWDDDLSFAGLALQMAQEVDPARFFLNAGVFPIDSDGFGGQTPTLWSTQVGASLHPFGGADQDVLRHMKLTFGLAYHDYLNTAKQALVNTQAGNTVVADDFNELNPSLQLTTNVGDYPVTAYGDWVRNVAIASNNDGYQMGLKVGKAKTPWSWTEGWEAGYFFERLEADAAFDGFVDSDFGGGGTNHQGNAYWIKFAVLKNSTIGLKYIDTEQLTGSKDRFDTFQVDWVSTF